METATPDRDCDPDRDLDFRRTGSARSAASSTSRAYLAPFLHASTAAFAAPATTYYFQCETQTTKGGEGGWGQVVSFLVQ